MSGMKPWTPEEVETLIEGRKKGLSFGIVALKLKRSRASVAGKVRKIKEKEAGQLDLFRGMAT